MVTCFWLLVVYWIALQTGTPYIKVQHNQTQKYHKLWPKNNNRALSPSYGFNIITQYACGYRVQLCLLKRPLNFQLPIYQVYLAKINTILCNSPAINSMKFKMFSFSSNCLRQVLVELYTKFGGCNLWCCCIYCVIRTAGLPIGQSGRQLRPKVVCVAVTWCYFD